MTAREAQKLTELPEDDRTRVCEIRRIPNHEHESRCLLAWKRREHPEWSQHAVSYRVTGPKIRRIK